MIFMNMVSIDAPFNSYLSQYNVLMFASGQRRIFSTKSLGGGLVYPQLTEAPWNVDNDPRTNPRFTYVT